MFRRISPLKQICIFFVFSSLVISGCDSPTSSNLADLQIGEVVKNESGWPRSIMTRKGLVTLEQAPKRIVSTSVTLSGTLLAIDAPLVASGATMPNSSVASEQGFMRQWADIAKERNITALYETEPNAEAIIQANPDLIIISATGGDSAMKLYDQLKDIAPTLVIGYDDKSWLQLAHIFGDLFGIEEQATATIERFQQKLNDTKNTIQLPPQPTTAMVYFQDSSGANIWTSESAQGRLLEQLGFTLAELPESVKGDISMGIRKDIVTATGERFPDAIAGESVFLFAANQTREADLKANSYLKGKSAIQNNHVYAMGDDTFRLDYYSSSNLLTRLKQKLGHKHGDE